MFSYAPFAAAAWSSHSMACCTGGYCNIPKHHHQKASAKSATAEDCGHDMTNCSMSCCQDPDKPAVASVAFVMPPTAATSTAVELARPIAGVPPIEIPRTIKPVSPPPRINPSLL